MNYKEVVLQQQKVLSLIENKKFDDAFKAIINIFNNRKSISNKTFNLLYKIVCGALDNNNLELAFNAARYGEGWFGYINVPQKASWNNLIKNSMSSGAFPKTKYNISFLKPQNNWVIPKELHKNALKIYKLFEKNNLNIKGYEVNFDAYGETPKEKLELSPLYYKVNTIKGKNFCLGFSLVQGSVENSWNLNNTAGFNFIAVPNFIITFFSDNSGPSIYKYSGNNWEKEISKIMSPHFSGYNRKDWEEEEFKIYQSNEVCIQDLFSDNEHYKNLHTKKGLTTKKQYSDKAAMFLEKIVIPKLEKEIKIHIKNNSTKQFDLYKQNQNKAQKLKTEESGNPENSENTFYNYCNII